MLSYRVKQVAQMAGVSVRTLHHYDQIGLLEPAYIGENSYRYYTRDELVKLQQILFFKDMGLSLSNIAKALKNSEAERAQVLIEHKKQLQMQARRQNQLINTIDRTIDELLGNEKMKVEDLYKGFSEEKQHEHEQWLIDNHGRDMKQSIDAARTKIETDAVGGREQLIAQRMAELQDIESEIILALQGGIACDDPALDEAITRHRNWVAKWWGRQPDHPSYIGLSQMYQSHPDFIARYEALAPGFTEYLGGAMASFANRCLR
ncbi:MerR family transcriptional regulator [Maritalea sp.]|jgi:DNA-binding transcriptional MerR regulator|uniref:MerR family transcriptional regulator n=1 Tax=Maritalea sp. TaxID=2003361 RepID=UPI0039E609F3